MSRISNAPIVAYTPAGGGTVFAVIAGLKWGLAAAAAVLLGKGLLSWLRRRHPPGEVGR